MTDSVEEVSLLPCPFCGSYAFSREDHNHSTAWEIDCGQSGDLRCEVRPSVWARTKPDAIAAWNRRAIANTSGEYPDKSYRSPREDAAYFGSIWSLSTNQMGELEKTFEYHRDHQPGFGTDYPGGARSTEQSTLHPLADREMSAALVSPPAGAEEPVAWQYGDDWNMPVGVDFAYWSPGKIAEQRARWKCVRPLYSHPAPEHNDVREEGRDALLAEVISLIEDDMYGPGEAEDSETRTAFNSALRRQINRITSRLVVAPRLKAGA